MADGDGIRRRREAPEQFNYVEAFVHVANFVHNNQNGGGVPPGRPDTTEWRKQRVKTIKKIKELGEKLDSICVKANYGKATGNSAEIVGILASIVGSLMSLGGLPSGQMATNIGKFVQHSGTFIDGASNVIESLFSKSYLEEIEAVLKKDQELSRPLAEWLDYSRNLDEYIRNIFGVSLASEKSKLVLKAFDEFSTFCIAGRGFGETLSLMRQGRYSVYIGNDVKIEKLKMFFDQLSNFPSLGDKMRGTLSLLSLSFVAVQAYREGAQIYRYLMGVPSSSVVPTFIRHEIPSLKEVSGFCIFQAINLSLSVLKLINASSIIKHGTSKYSDAIKQLTNSLNWELTRMDNL